jgi:hypothetical protein
VQAEPVEPHGDHDRHVDHGVRSCRAPDEPRTVRLRQPARGGARVGVTENGPLCRRQRREVGCHAGPVPGDDRGAHQDDRRADEREDAGEGHDPDRRGTTLGV